MNERIQELSEQCHWETHGVNGELLASEFDEQKFAQLILKECLDVALYGDEFEQARTNIKTLFGVEE